MILNNTLTTGEGGARSGSTNLDNHQIMGIRLLRQITPEIQTIIVRY